MIEDLANKLDLKWSFRKDDWFIDVLFNRKDLLFEIFRLKEYSSLKVNKIIYELDKDIKAKRQELEDKNPQFLKKKEYLLSNEGNENIQITLEQEYILKDLIEKYKIYEFIGWIHLGKNLKVFQEAVLEKQKIISRIYPLLDNTIRKVIGAKSIKLQDATTEIEYRKSKTVFDDAVNHAWTSIVNYFTKVDTSRIMFSLFTSVAQQAGYFYKVKDGDVKYYERDLSSFNFIGDDENSVDEDVFIDTVIQEHPEACLMENSLIEGIDADYIMGGDDNIDMMMAQIDGGTTKYLQQCLLSHCFNITRGQIKRICFDKIFAEFFADLINHDIPEYVITKNIEAINNVTNLISLDSNLIKDEEKNVQFYKLFRTWMKDKARQKLERIGSNTKNLHDKSIEHIVKRENNVLDYLKEHKLETIENLIRFCKDSLKLGNDAIEEKEKSE